MIIILLYGGIAMSFIIKDNILQKYIEEGNETEITVPDGVTVIGKKAFW